MWYQLSVGRGQGSLCGTSCQWEEGRAVMWYQLSMGRGQGSLCGTSCQWEEGRAVCVVPAVSGKRAGQSVWYQLSVGRGQGSHVVPAVSGKRAGQSCGTSCQWEEGSVLVPLWLVDVVKTTAGIQPVLASGGYINCE